MARNDEERKLAAREASRRWRAQNPDYWKKWRAKNPDYMKKWRAKNPDYMRNWRRSNLRRGQRYREAYAKRFPEKVAARAALNEAVRLGEVIRPEACEGCGKVIRSYCLHGHHTDYERPLDVEWLCRPCHMERHYGASNQTREHNNRRDTRGCDADPGVSVEGGDDGEDRQRPNFDMLE